MEFSINWLTLRESEFSILSATFSFSTAIGGDISIVDLFVSEVLKLNETRSLFGVCSAWVFVS